MESSVTPFTLQAWIAMHLAVAAPPPPHWTSSGEQQAAMFGAAVASAGDVNGDGYDDVIVGAPWYDDGEVTEGRAFVYHGSATGVASEPAWTADGNQTGAAFGTSVSSAGDVNGDGFDDVIIGAPRFDDGETDEGRAFVYLGSASGLASAPAWFFDGNHSGARLGHSVSTAGDVNGDGFDDVIIGAPRDDDGETDEGRAFVVHGSASGLSTAPAWTAEGDFIDAWFGRSVAAAGDVNGDGFDDVIVGAPSFADSATYEGRASVYHGSATGLSAAPAWTTFGGVAFARLGISVAAAGDVNGDGFGDVIVGAYSYADGQSEEGRAVVHHGSPTGLAAAPAWSVEGQQADAWLGYSVSAAGDVNGDGFDDVIVGAPRFHDGDSIGGRALVYRGSESGLADSAEWITNGNQAEAWFGQAVSTSGDVNGDGFDDVVVGAPSFDDALANEGFAAVYLGSDALRPNCPADLNGDEVVDGSDLAVVLGMWGACARCLGDIDDDGLVDGNDLAVVLGWWGACP